MDKSKILKTLLSVLVVFVFIYVTYLFVNSNFDSDMQTEFAINFEVKENIDTEGFILRNESYITQDTAGVVTFQLNESEKTNSGGVVAKIFSDEQSAANSKEIQVLEEEIYNLNLLKKASESPNSAFESVGDKLNNKMADLIYEINSKNYSSLSNSFNSLMFSINEKQIISGQDFNITQKLTELNDEKVLLESNSKEAGEIKSSKSGYFSSFLDGYEIEFKKENNLPDFSDENIINLTEEEINTLKNKKNVPQNAIGKVITDLNWYLFCNISKKQALKITSSVKFGEDLIIELPFASNKSISAELLAINNELGENSLVILKCNNYDENLVSVRFENVFITTNIHNGLRVSKQSLHTEIITDDKGNEHSVLGVYVLYGNKLIFKQVDIVYSGKDFVLCNPNPQKDKLINGETIELYDEIVTRGDELYDNKIIH